MRRLPVYMVIDVSESMVGEPINLIESGVETIIKTLRTDPNAMETVWVSIIAFAGKARTITPLQEILNFYPPKFPIGSGTSLSSGLRHLMQELDANVVKTTAEKKGDWKPIIFLLTDGVPTDDSTSAMKAWQKRWKQGSNLIAITIGNSADRNVLGQIANEVIAVEDATPQALGEFFRWLTASIQSSSVSVDAGSKDYELADLTSDKMSKIDLSKDQTIERIVDDNFIVLTGKCEKTKRPYLLKYERGQEQAELVGLKFRVGDYHLVGGYQVDESYFELSDTLGTGRTVNTSALDGAPSCPCCANPTSFAMCRCGGLHCIGRNLTVNCPWCGNLGEYSMGGGDGFNVERAQG